MRSLILLGVLIAIAGCSVPTGARAGRPGPPSASAEALIDTFYSFDPQRLRAAMAHAPDSAPVLLYYQGWAEGGNYVVRNRKPCRLEQPNEFNCAIIVKDDLIAALGTGYDVTDTFHITFADSRIVAVRTSSNDPPEFEEALKWVDKQRPTLFDNECRGFFKGGPTPQACAREVVAGFKEIAASRKARPKPE